MKQTLSTKLTILAGSALFSGLSLAGDSPAPAAPAASDVSVSISAGYTSEYVYRGALFGDYLFDFGIEASGSG